MNNNGVGSLNFFLYFALLSEADTAMFSLLKVTKGHIKNMLVNVSFAGCICCVSLAKALVKVKDVFKIHAIPEAEIRKNFLFFAYKTVLTPLYNACKGMLSLTKIIASFTIKHPTVTIAFTVVTIVYAAVASAFAGVTVVYVDVTYVFASVAFLITSITNPNETVTALISTVTVPISTVTVLIGTVTVTISTVTVDFISKTDENLSVSGGYASNLGNNTFSYLKIGGEFKLSGILSEAIPITNIF